jgi:hypothetical protein
LRSRGASGPLGLLQTGRNAAGGGNEENPDFVPLPSSVAVSARGICHGNHALCDSPAARLHVPLSRAHPTIHLSRMRAHSRSAASLCMRRFRARVHNKHTWSAPGWSVFTDSGPSTHPNHAPCSLYQSTASSSCLQSTNSIQQPVPRRLMTRPHFSVSVSTLTNSKNTWVVTAMRQFQFHTPPPRTTKAF